MSARASKRSRVETSTPSSAEALKRADAETVAGDGQPALSVAILNRQRTKRVNTRRLMQVALALLAELKIETAELGVRLVGAKEMARVNWQFLRHEGSTDVITFDHSEPDSDVRDAKLALRGELFVCVDDAIEQAHEFETTWQSEVVRYVVHGVLHLGGYDDLKPAARRRMKREENRLVRILEQRFPRFEI